MRCYVMFSRFLAPFSLLIPFLSLGLSLDSPLSTRNPRLNSALFPIYANYLLMNFLLESLGIS